MATTKKETETKLAELNEELMNQNRRQFQHEFAIKDLKMQFEFVQQQRHEIIDLVRD